MIFFSIYPSMYGNLGRFKAFPLMNVSGEVLFYQCLFFLISEMSVKIHGVSRENCNATRRIS